MQLKAEQPDNTLSGKAQSAPATISEIPGLGPIRVRAFAKAGIRSIDTLRAMTLDELTAVPGITRIKAQFIQDYLQAFSHSELEAAAARAEAEKLSAQQSKADSASPADWEGLPVSPFSMETARILTALVSLLAQHAGSDLRNRLLSSAKRLSVECLSAISSGAYPDTDQEKVLRRLRRFADSILAAADSQMDRKEQGRLADELSAASEMILTLREHHETVLHNRRRTPGI
jgi:nucleotidyltransferase/DNA polymerase involved in DNA repair